MTLKLYIFKIYSHLFLKYSKNREYLSNLTNTSSAATQSRLVTTSTTKLVRTTPPEPLNIPSKFSSIYPSGRGYKSEPKSPGEAAAEYENDNDNDYDNAIDIEDDTAGSGMAVIHGVGGGGESFEALYAYENALGTAPPSIASGLMTDADDTCMMMGGSTSASSAAAAASMQFIKSSQMTPPKSVESVGGGGQQSGLSIGGSSTSTSVVANATTGMSGSSTSTTTHNIPPISYDDLNNIFEEESSTDETQQQQQPQQQQSVSGY